MPRTAAFLAHNAIPVAFTDEDFDQVLTGNFVTKVIYLPDPEFQQLAVAGVETLVSTRLDPGVDPIVEADRRGADAWPSSGWATRTCRFPAIRSWTDRSRHRVRSRPAPRAARRRGRCRRRIPADELRRRRDGSAVRHADLRHADRAARTAARAAGIPRRSPEAHDRQPHLVHVPGTDRSRADRRDAGAGHQLSEAGEPRVRWSNGRTPVRVDTNSRWTAGSGDRSGDPCDSSCPLPRAAAISPGGSSADAEALEPCDATGKPSSQVTRPATMVYALRCPENDDRCLWGQVAGRITMVVVLCLATSLCAQAPPVQSSGTTAGTAAGSDWSPATAAGRTIARVFQPVEIRPRTGA